MAFINKAEVKAKNEALKVLNKEYGVKARFSGSNSSQLTLKIMGGKLDFIGNAIEVKEKSNHPKNEAMLDVLRNCHKNGYYGSVNHYYLNSLFSGLCLEYMQKAYAIMLDGHKDDSDIMTDYFNCSWYNHIQIGEWNKPFDFTESFSLKSTCDIILENT